MKKKPKTQYTKHLKRIKLAAYSMRVDKSMND